MKRLLHQIAIRLPAKIFARRADSRSADSLVRAFRPLAGDSRTRLSALLRFRLRQAANLSGFRSLVLTPLYLLALTCVLYRAQAQEMIHRYSFDADARDSVGTADGELSGNAVVTNGTVALDGVDAYVNLPNDLVSGLTNASFEMWVTWKGGGVWQRIFDFGNSSNGEDLQGAATQSIFLTPNNGSVMRLSIFPNEIPVQQVIDGPPLTSGVLHHLVWTYDGATRTGRLYVDGVQMGVNTNMTHTLAGLGPTANNWLGHSQYAQDSDFPGSIAEFRIYNGALSASVVATNFSLGPNPLGRGALLTLRLVVAPTMRPGGGQQIRVLADFENVADVEVSADPATTYQVSDTSVLSVTPTGFLTSVGSASGSATVTVSYQTKIVNQLIQVVLPDPAVLLHRYSFDTNAGDSVGTAHGELMGNAVVSNGVVVLDGIDAYVNLPNDLVGGLTNAAFEMWVIWKGGANWQRIFDFGNSSNGEDVQGAATQSIFLTPNNGSVMDLSIFPNGIGGQEVVTGPPLTSGVLHHVVWSYDAVALTARLYVDGVQVGVNSNMTHTLKGLGSTANNWLGHSQYIQDADFSGSIAEFRIYDGALSASAIATNFAQGPNPSGRGALQALRLVSAPVMRPGAGQQLRVLGDFENVSDFDVSAEAGTAYQVSDTAVFSVNSTGFLTAVGSASANATVTASYQGKTASQVIQVVVMEPAVLLHRYSFDTDARDSVGAAHGQLVGNAVVSNGVVVLDGTDAYVDLPNDLVSSLTNAAIEIWVTWNGGGFWQRIFDFGNSSGGEDAQGGATQSIFLTPDNGFGLDLSIFPNGIGGQQVVTGPALSRDVLHQVAWTYDAVTLIARLYVDGVQVGVNSNMTHTLAGLGSTANNWLGHSQYTQDADFSGSITEFRLYNGVMSADAVLSSQLAGPDNLPGAPAPRLGASFDGGSFVVTWPIDATQYALEYADSLAPGHGWTPELKTPDQQGGFNRVAVPLQGTQRYYRLRR